MPESVIPGPVSEDTQIREATCIHAQKIYDSCQAKDCMEELLLYPTADSQAALDAAQTVRAANAELLYVDIQVQPVGYNRGFYTIDTTYYYRVSADTYAAGSTRPVAVTGLASFSKRSMLFGSQGTAKIFSSEENSTVSPELTFGSNLPIAIVEAVDPIVLSIQLTDRQDDDPEPLLNVPEGILEAFDGELQLDGAAGRQLRLALGQFSILRLERDSQMLIPIYDYCMPSSDCNCDSCDDDPCTLFQQVDFPVGEFFPPATADSIDPVSQLRNVSFTR